jgi:hypothetical protein
MLPFNHTGSRPADRFIPTSVFFNHLLLRLFFPAWLLFLAASGCRTVQPQAFPRPDPAQPAASRLVFFAKTGHADTVPALLEVVVRDQDSGEPVQSATVVLQRLNSELQYGQLTGADGRCRFAPTASSYSMRIQYTGLITFYRNNLRLLSGGTYRMEIEMASSGSATAATMPLRTAVPSGKSWFRRRARGQ